MNKSRIALLVVLIGLSLWLQRQPQLTIISYPLLLISTVPHEVGHGLAALLCGENFISLEMHADGSGQAMHTISSGRIDQAFIAAAGLIGPAIAAAFGFFLASRGRGAQFGLATAGMGCLILVATVVKGLFANCFIGGLGLLLVLVAALAPPRACQLLLVFLAVQLSLSVFSRSDYLFTRSAGSGPSDVEHIAQNLFLPYWFWGGLCAIFSLVVLIVGAWDFLSPSPNREE